MSASDEPTTYSFPTFHERSAELTAADISRIDIAAATRELIRTSFTSTASTEEIETILDKNCLTLKDLPQSEMKLILSKYGSDLDKLRWALKPILLKYLLESKFGKVVYVDNDIFFFSSPLPSSPPPRVFPPGR